MQGTTIYCYILNINTIGLIEKKLKFFSHYKSMRAIDHWGLGQFATKGLDWQDLSGGALDFATY